MSVDPSGVTSVQPLRICRLVTVPLQFQMQLFEQLRYLTDAGLDVTLVADATPELHDVATRTGARAHGVPMVRPPSIWKDLRAIWLLYRLFRRARFDVVHSQSPKAGLLSAIAGWMAGVRVRMHTFTGQRWIDLSGPMATVLRRSDWLIGRLCTSTLTDGPGQAAFLIEQGVVKAGTIGVLGAGSVQGVNLRRFDPAIWRGAKGVALRAELGIDPGAFVIVFCGRVTRDKGISELLEAFESLRAQCRVELLIIGPLDDDQDPVSGLGDTLTQHPKIHWVGQVCDPERYLGAADIFCFPSYREGFPTAVIEASAMRLPIVGTRVAGVVETVREGETGVLVPPRDVPALTRAVRELIDAPDVARRMGEAGRAWVERGFDSRLICQAAVDEYQRRVADCERG